MSLFDRVRDTTTTTGTGSVTLANSAPTGFRTFGSVFSNNDRVYYAIVHQSAAEWETGFGTYLTTGPALARTVVLASSNSGSAVNFSAGTKDVFVTPPAAAFDRTLIVPGGRLTTESGVAVSTSDRTSQSTLYYTPYTHNQIHLFNGSVWRLYSFTERSLSLSGLTSGAVYDVFLYDNSGTLTLELTEWVNSTATVTIASPAVVTWTGHGLTAGAGVFLTTTGALPTGLAAGTVYYVVSPTTNTFQLAAVPGGSAINTTGSQSGTHTARSVTTRGTALTTQDGVLVRSGATTRRYLGTIRTTGTTTTEDSGGGTTSQTGGKRFVWNAYNQVPRPLAVIDTTDSWSYTTGTIRQANGATGNRVEWVAGLASALVSVQISATVYLANINTNGGVVGVGIDSTTAMSGVRAAFSNLGSSAVDSAVNATYRGTPGLGYHYAAWLEKGATGATPTCIFTGDNGADGRQSGINGEVWG